ncbi:MAG: hypothetical protein U0354_01265 [Candidatus Sericytochromatia bacterium]
MKKTLLSSMVLSSVITLSSASFAGTMEKPKTDKQEHKVETKVNKIELKNVAKTEKKSDKKSKVVNNTKKMVVNKK